jgi:hypothetical protein
VRFALQDRWDAKNIGEVWGNNQSYLISGMLRSPSVDSSSQLFSLLDSKPPEVVSIRLTNRGNDALLHDVVFGSPQRIDVAEWLLEQGASFQQKVPPKDSWAMLYRRRAGVLFRGRISSPWYLLRQAVRGGNEKIVHLFLERGADPMPLTATCWSKPYESDVWI